MTFPDATPTDPSRLDGISTRWTLFREAHDRSTMSARPARNALALRYYNAVRRYLGAMLRDDNEADEVSQEVMTRILEGSLAQATPERGRFRDFLKGVVRNVAKSHVYRRRPSSGLSEDIGDSIQSPSNDDNQWTTDWRNTILDAVWSELESYQQQNQGSVFHTVLKLRIDHPDDDSEALARRLSRATGKKFQAPAARQQLHRARKLFVDRLVDEITRGLDDPSPENIAQELADLGLMVYVEEFLDQKDAPPAT